MSHTLHFGGDHACTCQTLVLSRPHLTWRSIIDLIVRTTNVWRMRSRQRHALGELDDRMLRDIGISPAAAASEAAKPFWQ